MAQSRLLYRGRQFFTALLARVEPDEIATAVRLAALPPAAAALFRRLPRPYQRHALNVMQRLAVDHPGDAVLLQAALLHDSGKWDPASGRRVLLPYRVAVTLLRRTAPGRRVLARLGRRGGAIPAWRYPFVLQQNHAELGAALARRAGLGDASVALIRLHEQPPTAAPEHLRVRLATLQQADDLE